jgi:hypothetical protein
MAQYFIHLAPGDSQALAAVARRAAAAIAVLQPGLRCIDVDGPGWSGLVAPDSTSLSSSFARSADGAFDVLVAGAWFVRGTLAGTADTVAAIVAREGIDGLASVLQGPFAIAVHDRRRRELNIVTDLAGTMHAFAARHGDGWMVSTSSAWLAAISKAPLDPIAVHEFLAAGIVYENRTLWQGVSKLGQSAIFTFHPNGSATQRRYWSFAKLAPRPVDLPTSVERLSHALMESATLIGQRYPRVLCDITGGYDSRATIAGFMLAKVGFSGTVSGPESSADVMISRSIAGRFGIDHCRAAPVLRHDRAELERAVGLTDGEYDAVEYARIAAIHGKHASGHDVSVNGSFGELARGYWWELLWPFLGTRKPLNVAMLARRRFAPANYEPSLLVGASRFDFASHMADVIARTNAPLEDMSNTMQMDHAYFALRMHRWQGRIASSTSRIWPTVSPFAFRSVIEPVLEAETGARFRSLLIRTFLAKRLPLLAAIPLEAGYPAVPARLNNLHLFYPVVSHYASRVYAKFVRTARRTSDTPRPADESSGFGVEDVDELVSSGTFAPDAVRGFLDGAKRDGRHSRLATIALVLRKVRLATGAPIAR